MRKPKVNVAPNLPTPPDHYSPLHFNQFSNVLRLYFNGLDNALSSLFSARGLVYLSGPHISAISDTDQFSTGDDTPGQIILTSATSLEVRLNSGAIEVPFKGTYSVSLTLQAENTDAADHELAVWLRVGSADVAGSARVVKVPALGSVVISSSVLVDLEATDVVSVWWATDKAGDGASVDGVFLRADPAQAVPYDRPLAPSATVVARYVSNPPQVVA